jgi:internalin A
MRQLLVISLFFLLIVTPLYAQHNEAYQIALQRIQEAAETNATELDLDGLGLTELPSELWQLNNLEYLYINGNITRDNLHELPPEIGQLTNLVELWLQFNELETLPPEIGNLENLEVLVVNYNELTWLPPEIGRLHNLRGLAVWNNNLVDLPPEIGQLANLEFLSISYNHFRDLPPEIGQLNNLIAFHATNNQLSDLPAQMTQLTNLQSLELGWNNFRYLSDVFLELEVTDTGSMWTFRYARNGWGNYPDVHLQYNPLISPPEDIAAQGLPAIKQYLREQKQAQIRQLFLWITLGVGLVSSFVLAFRWKTRLIRKPKKKRSITETEIISCMR